MFATRRCRPTLGGLEVEYRIIQLHSRDAGRREAKFSFDVGQGTQDIGFRNEVDLLFRCLPAREITLSVRDENNRPTTAAFVIRDALQRVYPSQAKRLAPDFAFPPQVYRADGETLRLPTRTHTAPLPTLPMSAYFLYLATPDDPAWLASQPTAPNTLRFLPYAGIIARLGPGLLGASA